MRLRHDRIIWLLFMQEPRHLKMQMCVCNIHQHPPTGNSGMARGWFCWDDWTWHGFTKAPLYPKFAGGLQVTIYELSSLCGLDWAFWSSKSKIRANIMALLPKTMLVAWKKWRNLFMRPSWNWWRSNASIWGSLTAFSTYIFHFAVC